VETDTRSHVAAVVEAATAATAGAGPAISSQGSPRSGRVAVAVRATALAPSGAVVVVAVVARAAVITAALLLLLLVVSP
jgi:hypothetical protein